MKGETKTNVVLCVCVLERWENENKAHKHIISVAQMEI